MVACWFDMVNGWCGRHGIIGCQIMGFAEVGGKVEQLVGLRSIAHQFGISLAHGGLQAFVAAPKHRFMRCPGFLTAQIWDEVDADIINP